MHAGVHPFQQGSDERDENGRGDRARDDPDDQGVPFPHPKDPRGGDGVMPDPDEKFMAAKRNAARVEDQVADPDEGEEQGELQGIHKVIGDLRSDEIQAQDGGDCQAKQCGRTQQGIDPDDQAGDERPGQLVRAASNAQQVHDRADDMTLEERWICSSRLKFAGCG
jgi:hypothetical protein